MAHQPKKNGAHSTGGASDVVRRQTAVLLAAAMLLTGFIAGAVFGVVKTRPLSGDPAGATPAGSGQPPARMFQALEAQAENDPQNADAWTRLGNAYFDAGQYQKAIDAYEKSIAIEPDNANVLTDLGVMYRRNKQPEKAVEMFSRAMAADPRHEVSRMNKGIVLLYDLDDEEGAIRAWESLLEINPLATFGDGQSVDERVRHYREGHDDGGGK
jgi:cytochrome c-type biogenesis protein CcmH/NrfG